MATTFNGLRYFLCLVLGIALMWNVQKSLTDYLVERASLEDKKISLFLSSISAKAGEGSLETISGNPIVNEPISEQDRKITDSLFPAIALYAPNRRELIAAWSGKTTEEIQLLLVMDYPESQLSNAYRNLFVPPLTLGILTAISVHVVPNWYFLSKACNQYVLGGVQLKRPY